MKQIISTFPGELFQALPRQGCASKGFAMLQKGRMEPVYVQAVNKHGEISRLLCSKSIVAPIKPTTVSRLELCGAVLLAHLIANVLRMLNVRVNGIQVWSDSQVVLWWIRGDATRWKPFMANRVREIVELLPANHWHYVRKVENPVDLISRGTILSQLKNSKL